MEKFEEDSKNLNLNILTKFQLKFGSTQLVGRAKMRDSDELPVPIEDPLKYVFDTISKNPNIKIIGSPFDAEEPSAYWRLPMARQPSWDDGDLGVFVGFHWPFFLKLHLPQRLHKNYLYDGRDLPAEDFYIIFNGIVFLVMAVGDFPAGFDSAGMLVRNYFEKEIFSGSQNFKIEYIAPTPFRPHAGVTVVEGDSDEDPKIQKVTVDEFGDLEIFVSANSGVDEQEIVGLFDYTLLLDVLQFYKTRETVQSVDGIYAVAIEAFRDTFDLQASYISTSKYFFWKRIKISRMLNDASSIAHREMAEYSFRSEAVSAEVEDTLRKIRSNIVLSKIEKTFADELRLPKLEMSSFLSGLENIRVQLISRDQNFYVLIAAVFSAIVTLAATMVGGKIQYSNQMVNECAIRAQDAASKK